MTRSEYERAIVTIDKETLSKLSSASYSGKIVVVDTLEGVGQALEDLRKSHIIGFDTETRPSFRKGHTFNVSLIQLCTPERCYLFRTNLIGFPKGLIEILEDPNILKVGLSLHDDFHNMRKVTEIEPQGFIDLQPYVKDFKIADNSLSRMYGILFGKRISKGQRLTNWEAPVLSELQQNYAALDAYACISIYTHLSSGNFNPKESPYLTLPAEEEPQDQKSDL